MTLEAGTQTGSLINHLYSRGTVGQPEPQIGMGASLLLWTDRLPVTVVQVFKVGKRTFVVVQDDTSTVVKGSEQDGSAEYEYKANPNGTKHNFRCAENGSWEEVRYNEATGRWKKSDGYGMRMGVRETYRDPTF